MRSLLSTVLVLSAGAVGCSMFESPPPPPPYKAAIVVHGDPGQPLPGAMVSTGSKSTPLVTGPDGRIELVMHGVEGDMREVNVTCPPGHQQMTGSLQIRLTRLASSKLPEYAISCPPQRRKVVVAVRAENGPFLPVKYLNQVVATTDETGAAHFALEIEPGSFSVAIDTSDRKELKPPSPARIMTVGQQDDILVFDQRFELPKKKVIIYKPNIPQNITRTGG